jgi:hypothetical protein
MLPERNLATQMKFWYPDEILLPRRNFAAQQNFATQKKLCCPEELLLPRRNFAAQ